MKRHLDLLKFAIRRKSIIQTIKKHLKEETLSDNLYNHLVFDAQNFKQCKSFSIPTTSQYGKVVVYFHNPIIIDKRMTTWQEIKIEIYRNLLSHSDNVSRIKIVNTDMPLILSRGIVLSE